jgi:hypothetical protein
MKSDLLAIFVLGIAYRAFVLTNNDNIRNPMPSEFEIFLRDLKETESEVISNHSNFQF